MTGPPGPAGLLAHGVNHSSVSLRYHNLGPAKNELRLLTGIATLALLGNAQGIHSLNAPAADTLVHGGVIRAADDGVVGVDSEADQRFLHLSVLNLERLQPAPPEVGLAA